MIELPPGCRPPTPVDMTPPYEAWLLQRLHTRLYRLREKLASTATTAAEVLEHPTYKALVAVVVEAERTLLVTGWLVEKGE